MKRVCILFISSLLYFSGITQTTNDSTKRDLPNTEIEKFHLSVGKILRKEYINLYKSITKGWETSTDFEVKILKVTDATKNIELNGLRFEKLDNRSFSTFHYAYIDSDEIPSLLKFLEFLESLENKSETNYTEYIYNSKDLQFFGYFQPVTTSNKKATWVFGIQVDKYYRGSRATLSLKTIGDLKSVIQQNMNHFKVASKIIPNTEGL